MKRGDSRPEQKDNSLFRSRDLLNIADGVELDGKGDSYSTDPVHCQGFRHFALYIRLKSTGTPTNVQFYVEFEDPTKGGWHRLLQGPFASLIYEDTLVATEKNEVYTGEVVGRSMRVTAVGTGTTASATFTFSLALDLWN